MIAGVAVVAVGAETAQFPRRGETEGRREAGEVRHTPSTRIRSSDPPSCISEHDGTDDDQTKTKSRGISALKRSSGAFYKPQLVLQALENSDKGGAREINANAKSNCTLLRVP